LIVAASVIGRATAERFAAARADVVLADLADATDLATDLADGWAARCADGRQLAEADTAEFERMIGINVMNAW
jgi:3-hydroxyacyl-CoA dehydrogenase